MQEEYNQNNTEQNEIVYRKWQMVLLTVVQYVFDVIMTPVRSLIFGPSERQSLSSRLQGIGEKGERRQERGDESKGEKDEKGERDEKEDIKEKEPEKREPSVAEKRFKVQETEKILENVNARLETGRDASVLFLRSAVDGELINTVNSMDDLTVKDFEKAEASAKNLNVTGAWRDFDKLDIGLRAVMAKAQMDLINGTFTNDVEHDIATRNGVYHISVSPVYEQSKGGEPVLNDKSVKLLVTNDGREVNKSYLPPFTKRLDNCMERCMREISRSYHDTLSIDLTENIKLSLNGNSLTVDIKEKAQEKGQEEIVEELQEELQEEVQEESEEEINEEVQEEVQEETQEEVPEESQEELEEETLEEQQEEAQEETQEESQEVEEPQERTQSFSLHNTEDIQYLKEFLQEEFPPEKAEAIAEIVAMAYCPQEIVTPVDKYNHSSVLDGRVHSNGENYAYVREADTHTDICFSEKDVNSQETVHTVLSVTDIHKLTGQQLLDAADKYMELKGMQSHDNPQETKLHQMNNWSTDINAEQRNWQGITAPTVYSANETITLVDSLGDEINEYVSGMEYKGRAQFSEALLTGIYYNQDRACISLDVEATQLNDKIREFRVDISPNGDSTFTVTSDDKRFNGLTTSLSTIANENPDLTDSLSYYLEHNNNTENILDEEEIPEQEAEEQAKPENTLEQEVTAEIETQTEIDNPSEIDVPDMFEEYEEVTQQDLMEMAGLDEYNGFSEVTDEELQMIEELMEEELIEEEDFDMEECL